MRAAARIKEPTALQVGLISGAGVKVAMHAMPPQRDVAACPPVAKGAISRKRREKRRANHIQKSHLLL
jgi:hypothetical protein